MSTYAVARLTNVRMGPEIRTYLEAIDATLEAYSGRFIIHGGAQTPLEGQLGGDLIVIEFPDSASAKAWYASPAYQEILPLRLANSDGEVVLVDGVAPDHRAVEILRQ